jgi:hypothetical protein
MKLLVNKQEFKDLNVGFALDEGIVCIYYLVVCEGCFVTILF